MTERSKLPAIGAASGLTVPAAHSGNLIARGLAAIIDDNERFLSLPSKDRAEISFKLGMRYRYGDDDTQINDAKARIFLSKASELDHAEASYELCFLVSEYGEQDESDRLLQCSAKLGFGPALWCLSEDENLPQVQRAEASVEALAWYRVRAEAGEAKWQFEYAKCLKRDARSSRDTDVVLHWLIASAEQDNVRACYLLGETYLRGAITDYGTERGIHWLSRAAGLGFVNAARKLGELFLRGHFPEPTSGRSAREPQRRIVPDIAVGIAWYDRAIARDDIGAAYVLGKYYLAGELVDRDAQRAEQLLLLAANKGYADAQYLLGKEYASGARLRQDSNAAVHWLTLSAEQHTSKALTLAEVYLDGNIVETNYGEAMKWINSAANDGVGNGSLYRNSAMKLVCAKCFDGRFGAQEQAAARSWLAQMVTNALASVADMNGPRSEYDALKVGEMFELGLGVEKDHVKAVHWYEHAAARGAYGARERLARLRLDRNGNPS